MFLKSPKVVYFIDFDGTLVGDDKWTGFFPNTISSFKKKHFNPSVFDIRWSILTARPIIDTPFIKLACKVHKLKPQKIFTSNTFLYEFKTLEESYKFKCKFMIDYIEKQLNIEKMFYVDNNSDCNQYINSNKGTYPILALSVFDFYKGDLKETL